MWVIEGIWKYSCMATLIAHCPPGLVMPRGGGAPGILHTGPCLLTFCFDPPSPVILRLCVSVGRCPSSSRVGSRGRSYVSFCLPRLIMLWVIQFRILGISIWPKSNWDRPREISIAKSSVKKPQSTPAGWVPCSRRNSRVVIPPTGGVSDDRRYVVVAATSLGSSRSSVWPE